MSFLFYRSYWLWILCWEWVFWCVLWVQIVSQKQKRQWHYQMFSDPNQTAYWWGSFQSFHARYWHASCNQFVAACVQTVDFHSDLAIPRIMSNWLPAFFGKDRRTCFFPKMCFNDIFNFRIFKSLMCRTWMKTLHRNPFRSKHYSCFWTHFHFHLHTGSFHFIGNAYVGFMMDGWTFDMKKTCFAFRATGCVQHAPPWSSLRQTQGRLVWETGKHVTCPPVDSVLYWLIGTW